MCPIDGREQDKWVRKPQVMDTIFGWADQGFCLQNLSKDPYLTTVCLKQETTLISFLKQNVQIGFLITQKTTALSDIILRWDAYKFCGPILIGAFQKNFQRNICFIYLWLLKRST